jgi:hypothetical protein
MVSVATYHLSHCATPDYHDFTHLPKSGRPLASLGHVNEGVPKPYDSQAE